MTDRKSATPKDPLPGTVRARFDAPAAGVLILLVPMIGSVASGLVIAVAAIGCFRLFVIWRRVSVPRAVGWTAIAFAAFFLAEVVAGMVNWTGLGTLGEIGENTI